MCYLEMLFFKKFFTDSESPNHTTQESFSNSYELADSINF